MAKRLLPAGEPLSLRAAFDETIFPLLRAAGFHDPADGYSHFHMGVHRANCFKPYPDRLMVAAQFIDSRENAGIVHCRVFVAPWDDTSDSLECLQIGMWLTIYNEREFDEGIAAGIARRILNVDRCFPALREQVLAELASPPLPSIRARLILSERRLVEMIVGGTIPAVTQAWEGVLSDVAALPAKKLSAAAVSKRVTEFVSEHLKALETLGSEAVYPFQVKDRKGPLIHEAFYSELLRRRAKTAK
jgi:hypothetical protein